MRSCELDVVAWPPSINARYVSILCLLEGIGKGGSNRRIGQYVRNWWRWVNTGVEICIVNKVR